MSAERDCKPCKGGYYCDRVGSNSFDSTLNDTGTGPCEAGFFCKSGTLTFYYPLKQWQSFKGLIFVNETIFIPYQ